MCRFIICILCYLSLCSCHKVEEVEPLISIGIFGGSQSLSSHAQPIKNKWAKMFNAEIVNCGVVGAGFGSWQDNNIPNQVIINNSFDVYILWCSTNDVGLDITKDNENDPKTQSGGLKRVVELIKTKNRNARILLFTSIYVPHEKILKKLPVFVDKQIEFCIKHNIPYLNQFDPNMLDSIDFREDKVHLVSPDGYWKLEPCQTEFIKKYIVVKK